MSLAKGNIQADNLMTPSGTEKGKRDPRMAPGLSKFATTSSTFLRKVADGTSAVEKFGYRLERSRWSIFGHLISTGAQ